MKSLIPLVVVECLKWMAKKYAEWKAKVLAATVGEKVKANEEKIAKDLGPKSAADVVDEIMLRKRK